MIGLPWWVLQLLWLGTELLLMLVLVVAAIVQRRHLAVAMSLGAAAACSGWFAFQAGASFALFELSLLGGADAAMVSAWLLVPVSRLAGLVLWIALAVAVFAPRAAPPEPSADPFADG